MTWLPIESAPEGVEIVTKIDDKNGIRNVQSLVKKNRMFWTTDGSMYVYYTPTHWAPKGETP